MSRFHRLALLLLPALLWSGLAAAAVPAKPLPDNEICQSLTAEAETRYRVPKALLGAVAVTESGRWSGAKQAVSAWPWAINAEGKGQFFESKAEAVAEVKRLRKAGVRSIDVGCMQINLHHHPDAFESLEAAFDPATNVDYAARFLTELQQKTRSWTMAAGHYHSATPALNAPYRQKIMAAWGKELQRDSETRRQAIIGKYLEQREQNQLAQRLAQARRDEALAQARARTMQLAQIQVLPAVR